MPSPFPSWLAGCPDHFRPAVAGCAAGDLPPNVALLRLAIEAARPEEVEAALAAAGAAARAVPGEGAAAGRIDGALAMWRANPQAFGTVKAVLGGVEHRTVEDAAAADDPGRRVEGWSRTFDRLAGAWPEGGVALYALGNPDLLRAATDEVVALLGAWGLLGPDRRVLDLGCGIGRLTAALAPHVGWVTGLDVAPTMIARARERCAGLPNVALAVSSGRDLAGVADGSVDLVLAADVFPYLVEADGHVAARHMAEAARVLAPGGHLLVLNYSYRGDPGRDRADVAGLAAREGLEVLRLGSRDLALWDAAAFLLRRP